MAESAKQLLAVTPQQQQHPVTLKQVQKKEKKSQAQAKWWFGGLASITAALCTHPLDTLKIRMQTSSTPTTLSSTLRSLLHTEGPLALYAGLSASLLRQATYSTARFAVYDELKAYFARDGVVTPAESLLASTVAGVIGGFIGTPADIVNIRMQNDGKLPVEQRRGYRNAGHGLVCIARTEGVKGLWKGVVPNLGRGVLMTGSQVTSYDLFKQWMLSTPYFKDDVKTHFGASLAAGLVATTLCSPFDVLKTRIMSHAADHHGEPYKSTLDAAVKILRSEGVGAFLKGWVPSYTRLGPHTIITFMAYEQIKNLYRKLNGV
ncbi:Mitochondrial dicarboxylate transporter [Rhizophlyctis rosea]|nr:Mitochondrial dicarboxylate transporter [Rhizophlyctis rosea]